MRHSIVRRLLASVAAMSRLVYEESDRAGWPEDDIRLERIQSALDAIRHELRMIEQRQPP